MAKLCFSGSKGNYGGLLTDRAGESPYHQYFIRGDISLTDLGLLTGKGSASTTQRLIGT